MTFDAVMKRAAISATVDLSLHGIVDDPRRSMKNAVDLFSYLTTDIFGESLMSKIRREAENPRSCFYRMMTSMVCNVDHSILKKVGTNMCFNRVATFSEPEQTSVKTQCRRLVPLEDLCKTVEQAKAKGIYFFVICGSDSFRYLDRVFEVCRKNRDCVFYVTVESAHVSDSLAQKAVEAGNIILAVRIDTRIKPEEVVKECNRSFQILRNQKCLFGYIAKIGSTTAKSCCSDGFIDCMAKGGCLFGWYYASASGQQAHSCHLAVKKLMRSSLTSRSKPLLLLSPKTDRLILKRFVTGGRCYLMDSEKGIRCWYCIPKKR